MDYKEIIGYFASIVVAVGMLMSSIRLLRWLNLIGAAAFTVYGFLIGAFPVAIVNGIITVIDIYYLAQMYFKKEYFTTLPVRNDNLYLIKFLNFFEKDIQRFYPDFVYNPQKNKYSFFVLRNMAVAGVVLASEYEQGVLKIALDYTIPEYRDFKVGRFVYQVFVQKFVDEGYRLLITFPAKPNEKYIIRMGFQQTNYKGKIAYVKRITNIVDKNIQSKVE